MTNEPKYIEIKAKYVGEDERGNPLYEYEKDSNISEEERHNEPYRGFVSFAHWATERNLSKRSSSSKKDFTLRLEMDD